MITTTPDVRMRLESYLEQRARVSAFHSGRRSGRQSGQPHINLLIYQHVRGVTIIQVNSKKGAIWKTDMEQYRFLSK